MKLITRHDYAQTAPTRWAQSFSKTKFAHQIEITTKLQSLKPPFNPDEIDAIIGNDSWTRIAGCSECDRKAETLVEVGQEPDYESATAYLCLPCLHKVFVLAATVSA